MSIESIIQSLRLDATFYAHVTAWQRLPAQPARTVPFPAALDDRLAAALRQQGIHALYTHQAAAWHAASSGHHVAVVTPTASGKTLCYNLPVLHTLLDTPTGRALYLFPTKALAQDQLAGLQALERALPSQTSISPATYDGDTPQRHRPAVRERARIVLSNPDMLHTGILPHHPRWATFFANLRFVVVDELHAYRGVFGSHVANVLRRLRRVCRFYGSDPQFICTSATIANPREHAERLLETPIVLVDDDGAPRGERHFVFYNPPIVDLELGLRRSSTLEAEAIAARLVAGDVQTIVFARSRLTTELLLTYLRERVAQSSGPGPKDPSSIRGYRGGYLPNERRAIERGLRDGSVRAVVATNALELGVDIGGLDAAVLTGFPGTIASTWQQAGRAGRQGAVSLAILVATAGPLDQYIINHPEYFFARSPEHALANPDNLVILSNHIACAAFELPFRPGESFGTIDYTEEVLAYLRDSGVVQQHGGDWFWMGEGSPAQGISLRTASPDNVVIHARQAPLPGDPVNPVVIGELEREAVPLLLYEGAIYLHEGQSYLVERLDWDNGQALVTPAAVDYYTEAGVDQQVDVLGTQEETAEGGVQRAYGPVQVASRASAYRKVKLHTHETLGYGQIDLPEQVLETDAYWLAFTEELLEPLRLAGQWRSDPNDYGPNWPQQRAAARARDGYRCTRCGAAERGGREHDVHHKRPFRAFGYVPGLNQAYRQANELGNLATLCRSCHQLVERGQRVRTGLAGLAYVLGNVAPLHLMCDPRDLGVAVETRDPTSGLPTVTIYEKIPAGIGFSQRLYELHGDLLAAAADTVRRCPCRSGCPACVGPTSGDVDTDVDPKALTLALLHACLAATPAP